MAVNHVGQGLIMVVYNPNKGSSQKAPSFSDHISSVAKGVLKSVTDFFQGFIPSRPAYTPMNFSAQRAPEGGDFDCLTGGSGGSGGGCKCECIC